MNSLIMTRNGWPRVLLILSAGLMLLMLVYRSTLMSMVEIWERSDTFAHGFLIFPISLYLIWRRRSVLVRLTPSPDARLVVVFFLLGMSWLLSRLAGVLVVEQASFVGMIAALVSVTLGVRIAWEIAFPLTFLLFGVPFGEFLIPPMMNFTADFTVAMLELTGIPVYREGTFFSIPSGDWSVVEGCSGLRYLIASITLGFLYAYLNYRSLVRRTAFIALACTFPVVANGLRAYMIVMIAHLSDMKLALGVDHYIYGWVFFGLVMLLLFWIGSFWSEPFDRGLETSKSRTDELGSNRRPVRTMLVVVTALAISFLWPWRAQYLDGLAADETTELRLAIPEPIAPWQETTSPTEWEPRYIAPDAKAAVSYHDGKHSVAVYLLHYRRQSQDHELVNSQNVLVPQKHPIWRMPEEKPIRITLAGESLGIQQGIVQSNNQNLLVWRWNRVSGVNTVNDLWAKFLEASDKFMGSRQDATGVVLAIPYSDDPHVAAQTLQSFVDVMWPSIERSLVRLNED